MPLITRRWYDIPLRAALVATLVATVVTLSGWVGPKVSGMIALFPVVFSSMMLILHPRIGGPATAAVIANSGWGLLGFGAAVAMLHVTASRFGSTIALSLALMTSVSWNLGLWWIGRRRVVRMKFVIPGRAKREPGISRFRVRCFTSPRDDGYYFGSFAFSAYSASSASRGDISSGWSALSASISFSASLGGAGSAAARDGTANSGRSSASARAVWPRSCASSFASTDLARAITGGRKACELGDLNAVGAVGRARQHFVQEHDVALPFLDPHGGVEQSRQLGRERGEFMIMRGEQRAAAIGLMQVLDRRPRDRKPVEGRGARPISSRITSDRSLA